MLTHVLDAVTFNTVTWCYRLAKCNMI